MFFMEIESIEEERGSARIKLVFVSLFLILVIGLLVIYWIVPRESAINFVGSNGNFLSCSDYNFGNHSNIQFYENMRYVDSNISYRIENCPIEKSSNVKRAFYEIENKTVLSFYEVSADEEILVNCDSKARLEGNMFIAGEGGPSNITKLESFYIISRGNVLLIQEPICERPVVAIHELFHALGFAHSDNVCNIMHNFSKCSQEIGEDMIILLEELYEDEPLTDLKIGYSNGNTHDEYLDLNFSIQNDGIIDSKKSSVEIRADNKIIKTIEVPEITYGNGLEINLKNLEVEEELKEISLTIVYDFEESNYDNNLDVLFIVD